jgi:hypothetical protein
VGYRNSTKALLQVNHAVKYIAFFNVLLGFGGICPVGYYCPQGSVTPVGCPDGSYQDQPGKTYCKSCPAGYYCQNNASSYVSNECPVGM